MGSYFDKYNLFVERALSENDKKSKIDAEREPKVKNGDGSGLTFFSPEFSTMFL